MNIYNKTNHRKSKSKAFPGAPAFINSIKTIPYFVKMFFFDTDSIIFDDDISVFLVLYKINPDTSAVYTIIDRILYKIINHTH